MNIAIVIKYLSFPINGGIQQHVAKLTKHLILAGHDVTILTSSKIEFPEEIEGAKTKRIKSGNITIFNTHLFLLSELSFNLSLLFYILRRRTKFDTIHTHGRNGIFLHFFKPVLKNLIHTHHDLTINELNAHLGFQKYSRFDKFQLRLHGIIFHLIEKSAIKKMDRVITVSNKNKKELQKINDNLKTTIISNGIEECLTTNAALPHYFFYIGSLSNRKGIPVLINAVSQAVPIYPDIKLIIAGDGQLRSQYEKMTDELKLKKNINFVGVVNEKEKKELLSKCIALVNPSLAEGQGIVALEAMSYAKPVIASNIPGLDEVVENNVTGLTFTRGNSRELKEKLLQFINDIELAKKLGGNGFDRVKSDYLWKNLVNKVIDVYESVNFYSQTALNQ